MKRGSLFAGVLSTLLFVLTTIVLFIPLFPLALAKWIIPHRGWRTLSTRWLDAIASAWMEVNGWHQRLLAGTRIEVRDNGARLSREQWYLLLSNHQSWVDILVLLRVFNRRIPYLKFFLKQQLIWIPLLGLAWWALDFPFMRRYTREQLARNPRLKGRDVEETRRSCEKFRNKPVTIVSFVEGTRFTPAKHARQGAPFQHLLTPRAGGVAFTLSVMGDTLQKLLDVTICYPDGVPSYWDYVRGRVPRVIVDIREHAIDQSLVGDYVNDREFRRHFHVWLNDLWREKDQRLTAMLEESAGDDAD